METCIIWDYKVFPQYTLYKLLWQCGIGISPTIIAINSRFRKGNAKTLFFLDVTVFVLETNHSMSQKLAFMHFEILKKNQHSYN